MHEKASWQSPKLHEKAGWKTTILHEKAGKGNNGCSPRMIRQACTRCLVRPAYKKVQAACTKGLDISQRKVYVYNIVI